MKSRGGAKIVQYQILGPLRILDGRDSTFISARRIEMLLAVLLVRPGQIISTEQLITEIWGEEAPRRANAALHVYVSQLRKLLDRAGRPDSPIVTRAPGYLIRVGTDELDVHGFQQRVNEGRMMARASRHEEAARAFDSATSLWRGPVLGDMRGDGPILNGFVIWAEEARLECVELHLDSRLALGHHRELVGRIYALLAEHPLRESFYRQLMLALYRSERQADALKVYQVARQTLDAELGVEPCRSLRNLHHAILVADRRLDVLADSYLADPHPAGSYSAAS